MNQILRCDWLPERARWSHLAHSGLPALSRKKNFPKSHIINPLLTKLVRSRWLDIGLVLFFCVFMDLDSVSVHKHAKKELGQYPAILTSHLVNNPYILLNCARATFYAYALPSNIVTNILRISTVIFHTEEG